MARTVMSGSTTSPAGWPSPLIATACPRRAWNQRPIAVMAMWLNMPCPQKRRRKSAVPRSQTEGLKARPSPARAKTTATAGARRVSGTVSTIDPRVSSKAAEPRVATV